MTIYTYCIFFAATVFVFDAFFRAVRAGKKAGCLIAPATVIFLFAVTIASVPYKEYLRPLWFEDFVVIDFIVISLFAIIWYTRGVPLRNLIFGTVAVVIATAVALCGMELFLRVTRKDMVGRSMIGKNLTRNDNSSTADVLYREIPDAEGLRKLHEEGVTLNDYFGIRDLKPIPARDKAPGEKRVIWLGDSVTEGVQVMWDQRFVSLLEKRMDWPHYDLAVDGTGTDFAAVMLERYFDVIQPDLVMLGLYAANDCFGIGMMHERADFHVRPLSDIKTGTLVFKKPTRAELLFLKVQSLPPNLIIWNAANYTLTGYLLLVERDNFYTGIAKRFFFDNIAEMERKEAESRYDLRTATACALIERMREFTEGRGAAFGVVSLPFRTTPGSDDERNRYSYWHPEKCEKVVSGCVMESGIPFMDASGMAGDNVKGEEIPILLPDRVHLNPEGHELMAEKLEPFERELLRAR